MASMVSHDTLKGFLDAFNRHDLDAIMSYFAEDCVFYMPRGDGAEGRSVRGKGSSAGRPGDAICRHSRCALWGRQALGVSGLRRVGVDTHGHIDGRKAY